MPVGVFAQGQSDLLTSINASTARLASRYGISFKYADFPPVPHYLKFSRISSREYQRLNAYLSLFEEEIGKYPEGFFKDQGIRGIGLVTRLFLGDIPAQGLYTPKVRVMFFDISRFGRNTAQQRHNIHHEIFHMMAEVKGDFELLSAEAWGALNDPDFSYGKQTKPLREPNPYNRHAPNQPGFVTYYAMTAVQEDQAEVFACLMQEKHRRLIEQWAQNDEILAKKIKAMKAFAQYFDPAMGAAYWETRE